MSFDEPCVACGTRIDGVDVPGGSIDDDNDEYLCLPCIITRLKKHEALDCKSMLCTALGYKHNESGPSLAVLVQELIEDHAEKTELLKRVDEYLNKLDEINRKRMVDTTKLLDLAKHKALGLELKQ